jgi:hypothetical protein
MDMSESGYSVISVRQVALKDVSDLLDAGVKAKA